MNSSMYSELLSRQKENEEKPRIRKTDYIGMYKKDIETINPYNSTYNMLRDSDGNARSNFAVDIRWKCCKIVDERPFNKEHFDFIEYNILDTEARRDWIKGAPEREEFFLNNIAPNTRLNELGLELNNEKIKWDIDFISKYEKPFDLKQVTTPFFTSSREVGLESNYVVTFDGKDVEHYISLPYNNEDIYIIFWVINPTYSLTEQKQKIKVRYPLEVVHERNLIVVCRFSTLLEYIEENRVPYRYLDRRKDR